MIENQYVKEFNKYKKYKPSDSEVNYLRSDLYFFSKRLKIIFDGFKKYTTDYKKMVFFIQDLCKNCCSSNFTDSLLYEVQTINTILENPSIIDEVIPTINNANLREILHTSNQIRSQKVEIENAIAQIREIDSLAKKYKLNQKNLSNKIPENASEELKKNLKLYEAIINEPKQKEKIKLYLEARKSKAEKIIRNEKTQTLTNIGTCFSVLGFSDTYMESYNKTKEKFGFSNLNYDFSSTPSKKCTSFLETFSEDYLNTLSLRDLCFLTCHWSNRFSKECLRLSNYFTAIDSLDLWKKVNTDNLDFSDITDDSLQAVLIKSNYLANLSRQTFLLHDSSLTNEQLRKGKISDVPLEKDFTTYYEKIKNSVKQDYSNFFTSKSLKDTSFENDISTIFSFINYEMIGYKIKKTTLEPLVQSSLLNPHFKNWGIIRNELKNGNFVDSVTTNKNKVLLAFDIKGFNMPFRFHIEKDALMDILKTTNKNYLIPEYQGADDFYINNEPIPSNIIMPIDKEHKTIIMENSKKEGPLKKFWEHKYFLMNEKLPSHFIETTKKSKKKIETRRIPIVYTDLKTGERFIEEKGKFKEFVEKPR